MRATNVRAHHRLEKNKDPLNDTLVATLKV